MKTHRYIHSRLMPQITIDFPEEDEEREILDRMGGRRIPTVSPVTELERLEQAREAMHSIYVDYRIKEYVVRLVHATRSPSVYQIDLEGLLQYGASPRATLYLNLASRANAMLHGRAYATPQDVKEVAHDVLCHRVILTYEAEAEETTSDDVITHVLNEIPVP